MVASHGRHCMAVETPDGSAHLPPTRARKARLSSTDRALWRGTGQGRRRHDRKVQERRNLFYRQDEIRTKSFAANLDQVLILIAAEPVFRKPARGRSLRPRRPTSHR